MINGVIFDCFGVLTNDSWLPIKKKYFGHDPKLLRQATDLNGQANSLAINYSDFLSAIAKMANISTEQLRRELEGKEHIVNSELFAYIKTLKPSFKIGMLSNTSYNMLEELFSKDQIALFDEIILSSETGITKPNAKAYAITAERLGLRPSECVFIDDQERHVVGAESIGMRGIWYKDFDDFKIKLEKILSNAAAANN